ncbi:tubulin polyglutamylase TTLL4 isoform X4 [Gadus macrocephalus]|uniref:tubulin polyglutamylase TTLL4 isoform X4 n=1 Tax=Gadus macrocephalus TaxID=80720 RepID=UPI0028CB43FF|nr:tubulin polyglutamylase TTLL4 isoform X4 [Gadus macrocephalus]
MPTNQSSPWGSGRLRTPSKPDSPTTMTTAAKRALSPEEDMETSSAFHPDNQKHTATTKRPTKQSTAHNGYAPAEYQSHQVPSATQCSAPKTEAATCHSLPKPWPSASGEGCSLQSGWGSTILSSESSAYSTANEVKTKEPASCPAGAAVGAVANQISAIHLTKLTMPSLSASFSPHPPLKGEEEYDGGVKLSGNECFAKQMEGEEEEFPDEVEKGCDDDGSHDWLGCWGHHMKSPLFKTIEAHQKLNHFPGSFQIGRKDRLWRNLSKMRARFGKQEFSFFPRSFILPQDIRLLRRAWEDAGARQKWIIKPPASARGTGIQVIYKWCQMPKKRPLLVQKYLHKPYLISGNKFDLRIYVYVTSYDPLRIYIFSDGLVRFASCKYSSSMRSLGNKFMHLTNYSVNKKNTEYQTNSDNKACKGHKWALQALWQYLGAKGINTTLIWDKIKDMVIKTIIASDPYINSLLKMHVRSPYSCHELFGFDIMLDDKLKPWVLEVNISPSLHSNTALDVTIKGQMIRDVLNLAGFLLPSREQVAACSQSASSSSSSVCGGSSRQSRTQLSTDEKVKRAFFISQTQQDLYSSVLDVLTPEDVCVLAQSEDELGRRGDFERIFPSSSSSHYLRFFECRRYLNILLSQWEHRYASNRNTGVSLLRSLCQKSVHLGTSDPTHMWSKCSYVSRFETKRADLSCSSVAISWQRRIHSEDEEDQEDGADEDVLDREVHSISSSFLQINSPTSPSPGSTPTPTLSPVP